MAMTATQKIKWAILKKAADTVDISPAVLAGLSSEQLAEQIDTLYEAQLVQQDLHYDLENEFRSGQQDTDIEPTHPFERGLTYYEKKSVAAQMPDGSWVGWIYWFGGGKHSEPEAIDWMSDAYFVNVEEKPVQIIQRTFSRAAGFTLIELLIVIAILGIIGAVVMGAAGGSGGKVSWGVTGMAEERCIAGYKHVVGQHGQARQVMSEEGKGIPCN